MLGNEMFLWGSKGISFVPTRHVHTHTYRNC